ncbi:MAG: hypothetical protein O9327_05025 [Polaromonas sp.]|nr:hypothetical protein [Polaromonas sp.]
MKVKSSLLIMVATVIASNAASAQGTPAQKRELVPLAAAAASAPETDATVCPPGHTLHIVKSNKLEPGGVLATEVAGQAEPLRMRLKDDTQVFVARSSARVGSKICVRS